VSDDVDIGRIQSGLSDQPDQEVSDMLADKDGVVGGLGVVVPRGQLTPVDGQNVVVAGF
jgi:hypothetical protein